MGNSQFSPKEKNVGFISTRLAGTDGVSLETAKWAKVFEENRDLDGFEGQWRDTNGRCTIDLILDDTNFNKLIF